MKSETVGELFKALGDAQFMFPAIPRTKTARAGSYSYNYADLADVFDAIRQPLHATGLAITQMVEENHGGFVLTTILGHTSGEFIASSYPLTKRDKPQEMGSEITYARRYALVSILGIATDDDDDANSVQSKPKASQRPSSSASGKGQERTTEGESSGEVAAPAPTPQRKDPTEPRKSVEEVQIAAKRQLYRSVCKGKKLDPEGFCKEFTAGGVALENADLDHLEALIDAAKEHA